MFDVWYESPLFLNTLYAVFGVVLGIVAAILSYKIFSRIIKFPIATELENGNLAVGVVVCGIFIMIGLIVGLIIGNSLV